MSEDSCHSSENRSPYDAPPFAGLFACVYAKYWRDHSEDLLDRFAELDTRFCITPQSQTPPYHLLDIACGEGTFAIGIAKRGWIVTGLDLSRDMLALGTKHLQKERSQTDAPIDVEFMQVDMRNIALLSKYHVSTCWYNSVNYVLTEDDLFHTFRGIRAALVPEGTFLFDAYTLHGLSVEWETRAWVSVDEANAFVIADTRWMPSERLASVRFTGFLKVDGHYERFDERHFNRGYSVYQLTDMLQHAGFHEIEIVDFGTLREPRETTRRLLCVARVRAE